MKRKPLNNGRNYQGDIVDPEQAARHDFEQGRLVDWRTTKERYEAEVARLRLKEVLRDFRENLVGFRPLDEPGPNLAGSRTESGVEEPDFVEEYAAKRGLTPSPLTDEDRELLEKMDLAKQDEYDAVLEVKTMEKEVEGLQRANAELEAQLASAKRHIAHLKGLDELHWVAREKAEARCQGYVEELVKAEARAEELEEKLADAHEEHHQLTKHGDMLALLAQENARLKAAIADVMKSNEQPDPVKAEADLWAERATENGPKFPPRLR